MNDFDENLEPDAEQTEDSFLEPETDMEAGTDETEDPAEEEPLDDDLAGRLDELINILTPAESEEEDGSSGTVMDSEPALSSADAYSQELLESINGTLVMIKSADVSYQADVLYYQKEILSNQQHLSACFEFTILLLFAAAFFAALSAGCRLADSFFHRMRG